MDSTAPGTYTVVIKVASGANPGHVVIENMNENVDVAFSNQFGSNGGTFYPSGSAHAGALNTIGVAAVPWWAAAPYLNTDPLNSEPFSSFGPRMSVFNPDGSAKPAAIQVQSPVVSGADGGNTSFFGQVVDTSQAPFPGQPSTPTNLSQNLPSFFGTSSATPNAAAVAALMLQKNPGLTQPQIKAALIASSRSSRATAGTWNVQGGFGFVNAVGALNAIAQLSVTSTVPTAAAALGSAPSLEIIVTFSRPVQFSTISAA